MPRMQLAVYGRKRAIRPRAVLTLSVNSTGDADDATPGDGLCQTSSANGATCTLRAALTEANASGGGAINFAIPGAGVNTITLGSALPIIAKPVVINGYSQTGSSANTLATGALNAVPLVQIVGNAGTGNDLTLGVGSGGSSVRGLILSGAGDTGIELDSPGNTVAGCFIGTNAAGALAQANSFSGVRITGFRNGADDAKPTGNIIGGVNAADRNLISGNGATSAILAQTSDATGALIQGNLIGLAKDGATALTNNSNGIGLLSNGNTIKNNVISGNGSNGIACVGSANNTILGNIIGFNAAGDSLVANQSGIYLQNSPGTVIGDGTVAGRNVVTGGANPAIWSDFNGADGSSGTKVQGNYVGTNAAGTTALGSAGIYFFTPNNLIGGTTPGQGNVIGGLGRAAIQLQEAGAQNNVIQGNLVGVSADGQSALSPGGGFGIGVLRASSNTIGGASAGARNVIVAANSGINLNGPLSGTTVQGNFVGVNASGSAALPATASAGNALGIINASNTTISGNVFSNSSRGITLFGSGATGNTVQGNFVGTDATGQKAIPNGIGIAALTPQGDPGTLANNTIGGAGTGQGNVISGNNNEGLLLNTADSLTIRGNKIGVAADGTTALPNGLNGIEIGQGSNNQIGGVAAGAGNIIAFNGTVGQNGRGAGVKIFNGTGNAVQGNSIYGNRNLGIDLSTSDELAFNVTPNQSPQTGGGPNNRQNYPVIVNASGSTVGVNFTSKPSATYRIEVFASDAADPSGFGQGQTFLGAQNVTTNAQGNTGTVSITLPSPFSNGKVISATATSASGDTSEFSAVFIPPTARVSVVNSVGDAPDTTPGDGNCNTGATIAGGAAECTLRAAIQEANGGGGASIKFNIPGAGVQTIVPATQLPDVAVPVTVDALTQPGASANTLASGTNATLLIQLDGSKALAAAGSSNSAFYGLRFVGGNSIVRGFVVNGFGTGAANSFTQSYGVAFDIKGGDKLESCFIGTDPTGTLSIPNKSGGGVQVNADATLIGGTSPAARNLISGNGGAGVQLQSTNGLVQGDLIGTDATGLKALPNQTGILVAKSFSSPTTPSGNVIGTQPVRTMGAVKITRALTAVTAATNVISGNSGAGITNQGDSTTLADNFIGVGADSTTALGNGAAGVNVFSSSGTPLIGGPSTGNIIAFNGLAGITIGFASDTSSGFTISRNSIYSNKSLGIDLGGDGVTPNDAGDADTGANGLQNFPVITSFSTAASSVTIGGTLNSKPNATYTVELFQSDGGNASGYGEGQRFLGTASVTTDAAGNGTFTGTFPTTGDNSGPVSATATDAGGNTSEFARDALPDACSTVVTNTLDTGAGSLRRAMECSNSKTGAQTISFNIPGAGVQTIKPITALPTLTNAVTLDGLTQPAASANTLAVGDNAVLKVEIDGTNTPGDLLHVTAGSSTVRGLILNRVGASFQFGGGSAILFDTLGGDAVEGCFIGTDATGATALPNHNDGVKIVGISNNRIGGALPAQRNLLSGNYGNAVRITVSDNFRTTPETFTDATQNSILGNYIGSDASGTKSIGNGNQAGRQGSDDVRIEGSNNTVGGPTATPGQNVGNLIVGAGDVGLRFAQGPYRKYSADFKTFTIIGGNANLAQGNIIGLDATGTKALGNGSEGLDIRGTNCTVGGANSQARNVISGNGDEAMSIDDDLATGNKVLGNFLGTDISGTKAIGNSSQGIFLNAPSNVIGGVNAGEGNVISGNGEEGILASRVAGAGGNVIQGNFIGTDLGGTLNLGNGKEGIRIHKGTQNTIIGLASGATGGGNTIAFNGKAGITVAVTDAAYAVPKGNRISGNSIFSNGGLGIDLNDDGVTLNDPGDTDSGPNDLQNFPVITGVSGSVISGTLNAAPTGAGESYRIELFSNAAADPSGYGEGEQFLGFTSVPTDASGNVSWNFTSPVSIAGRAITATATYVSATAQPGAAELAINGDTSEFSKAFTVGGVAPTPTPQPTATAIPTATPTATPAPTATAVPTATPSPSKANTTTTLSSAPNPSNVGQSVTLTATVSLTAPTTPTTPGTNLGRRTPIMQGRPAKPRPLQAAPSGTVTFYDGQTPIGTGTLSGGVATLSTSALAAGTHPLTATYGGDANYNGSTSNTVSQVVNGVSAPALALTQRASVNTVSTGGEVDFTLVVKNTGSAPATDASLIYTLPAGATLLSSTPAPTSNAEGMIGFSLGTLAPNASQTVIVRLTAPATVGTLQSNAIAGATGTIPVAAQVTVPIANGVPAYTFGVGKLINVGPYSPSLYHPGAHLIQYVTITNTGSASANAPLLLALDGLPSSVTVVGAAGTDTNGVPLVSVPLAGGALGVGGRVQVRLEFRLKRADKPTFTPHIVNGAVM